MISQNERQATILVVDDAPQNIAVLNDILRTNYRVLAATSGEQALAIAGGGSPPDIILLDVIMPGIDGIEVCRRLKADPRTQFIPVVMVTTLSGLEDRVKALDAGADDFLTKPIEPPEVRARVRSLLRIKSLHDELQSSYERLQQLQELRENLTHMIVHDLRTPLTAIMGSLELMPEFGDFNSDETLAELHEMATTNSQQLLTMINDLLDITKMESGQMVIAPVPVALSGAVEEIQATVVPLARASESVLEFHVPEDLPDLQADPEILRRVLINLLGNAIKFTPPRGRVSLSAVRQGPDQIRVSVMDTGPGIPLEYHVKIFEKFGQVENPHERKKLSTGLGLTFCKMAVEAHGGRIGIDSTIGQGSTFYLDWPMATH